MLCLVELLHSPASCESPIMNPTPSGHLTDLHAAKAPLALAASSDIWLSLCCLLPEIAHGQRRLNVIELTVGIEQALYNKRVIRNVLSTDTRLYPRDIPRAPFYLP